MFAIHPLFNDLLVVSAVLLAGLLPLELRYMHHMSPIRLPTERDQGRQ